MCIYSPNKIIWMKRQKLDQRVVTGCNRLWPVVTSFFAVQVFVTWSNAMDPTTPTGVSFFFSARTQNVAEVKNSLGIIFVDRNVLFSKMSQMSFFPRRRRATRKMRSDGTETNVGRVFSERNVFGQKNRIWSMTETVFFGLFETASAALFVSAESCKLWNRFYRMENRKKLIN